MIKTEFLIKPKSNRIHQLTEMLKMKTIETIINGLIKMTRKPYNKLKIKINLMKVSLKIHSKITKPIKFPNRSK